MAVTCQSSARHSPGKQKGPRSEVRHADGVRAISGLTFPEIFITDYLTIWYEMRKTLEQSVWIWDGILGTESHIHAGGEMRGWFLNCALLVLSACFCLFTSASAASFKQETRWVEASIHHPSTWISEKAESVDRKQIDIEPDYDYVSHFVSIVSASPEPGDNVPWSCSDGLVKGADGRVESVWIEVRAQKSGFFSSTVHVRARLVVTVQARNPAPEENTVPTPSGSANR